MKTAHCKHNILKTHFDITWKHLQEALLHFSVPVELIDELKAVFYSVEGDIVKDAPAQKETQPLGDKKNIEESKGCPFAKIVKNQSHK